MWVVIRGHKEVWTLHQDRDSYRIGLLTKQYGNAYYTDDLNEALRKEQAYIHEFYNETVQEYRSFCTQF
jgi:hypothetical protein